MCILRCDVARFLIRPKAIIYTKKVYESLLICAVKDTTKSDNVAA
jgi:hypothetical protein